MLDAFKRGLIVLFMLSLVACGGGGGDNFLTGAPGVATGSGPSDSNTNTNSGDDGNDDTAQDKVADLEVAASSQQLGSNDPNPVTISAVVKDENNNVLKDVEVKFAVNNNGTIEPADDNATNSVKTASLTAGLNRPANRTMVVTVTAGEEERTLDVDVTGTLLQIDGPERIVINAPTEFVVTLKDSTGAGLMSQVLSVQSANGSAINSTSDLGFATDSNGEVKFTVTASASGDDTVTASALGANYAHEISISGDQFMLDSENKEIDVNTNEEVSLIWTRDGTPQAEKMIKLTATRGVVPSSVQTDSAGKASFTLSSSTAGGTVVTAVGVDSGLTTSIVREFVAVTPKYLSAQSEQATLGPEERTTIIALVRDTNDNPVKNQKVTFNLNDAVNGSLSSSIATTDSLGKASVVYTAGNATSAKDGVVIQVRLQDNTAVSDTVSLTVGQRALRIVLGSDETLEEEGVFYQKSYGVIVTDSAGNPVPDKSVDFTLIPTHYHKGEMVCSSDDEWQVQYAEFGCASEDINNNGRLDEGEDVNASTYLEPTHTATINTRAVTDAEGKATVQVTYPQSEALWSRVRLVAQISDDGTEYYESVEFILPILAGDVSSCDVSAPNAVSSYGVQASCQSPQ